MLDLGYGNCYKYLVRIVYCVKFIEKGGEEILKENLDNWLIGWLF